MDKKITLIMTGIFLIGVFTTSGVFAGELAHITPSTFEVSNLKSGDYFHVPFSFEYLNSNSNPNGSFYNFNSSDNYNNAPIVFRINITAQNPTPAVWKGDFVLDAQIKEYTIPGHVFLRTVPLNCTEAKIIEFHSANGIDLRYINDTPNGTFYCYNPSLYLLQLNSQNEVSLGVKTNFLLYPGSYNMTIEFLQTDEYAIPLNKGWNLISFPFPLANNSVGYLFNESAGIINSVWSYENGMWIYSKPDDNSSELKNIIPGRGYWVKSNENTFILVGMKNLLSEQTVPPQIEVNKGWNLIGHYGLASNSSYCSLFSITNTNNSPKWFSIVGFDSWNNKFEKLNDSSMMNPGEGYWVGMNESATYFPSTLCPKSIL